MWQNKDHFSLITKSQKKLFYSIKRVSERSIYSIHSLLLWNHFFSQSLMTSFIRVYDWLNNSTYIIAKFYRKQRSREKLLVVYCFIH
jgi:hypothetical protein